MDEAYDVIVLGTGLKECILSGLLSVDGLKVLHMDRNDYYGGESTSLNLSQLWKRFRGDGNPPEHLGSSREYNVDMIPKFMMANGALVRVLIHTSVTKYLNFKAVDGSYVYNKKKIHKVPANDVEALKSPLMGLFEKRRAGKFFIYVQGFDENDPKSNQGLDLNTVTAKELISKYGLDDNTIDFIGHALALYLDDDYLDQPAIDFVKSTNEAHRKAYDFLSNFICKILIQSSSLTSFFLCKIFSLHRVYNYEKSNLFLIMVLLKLYAESLARFQGGSPYIYPLYGLGELPQGFARLSAVYGGTYMLNKPECKVEFDESGKVVGVTSDGETAKCEKVVCDPSYLPDKVKKVGKVARAICIMSHPIPNTNDSSSCSKRKISKYIAFVTTEAETDNPEEELKPGIDLLEPTDEIFFDTYDRYEPVNQSADDNCFISTSYDATTHFETTVRDVIVMYGKITGKELDLSVDLSAASAAEE